MTKEQIQHLRAVYKARDTLAKQPNSENALAVVDKKIVEMVREYISK